jgi:hypothetical protein
LSQRATLPTFCQMPPTKPPYGLLS